MSSPNPSVVDYNAPMSLDKVFSVAPACGGRISNAVEETLALMRTWLNPTLVAVNEKYAMTLPAIQNFALAGTLLGDEYPQCIIGFSSQGEQLTFKVDQEWITLSISIMYSHIEGEKQMLDCLDICCWVRAIMQSNRGLHLDELGRPCWKSLKTGSIMPGQHAAGLQGALYQITAWQPGDATNRRDYFDNAPVELVVDSPDGG